MQEPRIFTVTELTRDIRGILEGSFREVWVEGEVSNFTVSSAGHVYFSLKDASSVINCVMFKSSSRVVSFTVEDGMHVLCGGRVSVYDKRGQYQLYVSAMEPRGKGALQLAFEQLKKKLYKEGLFSEEHKKPLPYLPVCVGVVTSPTGAAIRDILKVVHRRFANVEVLIRPVRVQGDGAKEDIVRAIKELNEFNEYARKEATGEVHPIDVMIVGRGGGSLEDLWAFNEEEVARAIYASEVPVISAVGHEIDYTISDFAADHRAPTPSAAAEMVIPLKSDLIARVNECARRANTAVKNSLAALEKEVFSLKGSYVLRAPMNVFTQMRQQVDDLAAGATSLVRHFVEISEGKMETVSGKLKMLSPLAVLERGYSITFSGGKVIKKASVLKKGDALETRFARGRAASTVENVREE